MSARSGVARVFLADDGKLRPIIRVAIFAALGFWLLSSDEFIAGPFIDRLSAAWHIDGLTPGTIAFYETINLLTALVLTGAFAIYERRAIDSYGFPLREAFGVRFWEGFAIGVANTSAVALGMIAFGGMTVHGFALAGSALVWGTLAWLGANVLVGLAEELLFRGYLLQTLRQSVGFWPAAVLLSLWFTADHYFFKPVENVWDAISLFGIAMWVCYTVLKTGNLWLAIGYHAAFDFMQLFVVGTANGGRVPSPHLLNAAFPGPAWLNGGVLGLEASFLMYPALVLMFVYAWRRFGRNA